MILRNFKFGLTTFILLVLGIACQENKKEEIATTITTDSVPLVPEDSLKEITSHNDSLKEIVSTKEDPFFKEVELFSADFVKYNPTYEHLIDTIKASDHWFFKVIERHRKIYSKSSDTSYSTKNLSKLPNTQEINMIEFIRQACFYKTYLKSNDLLIEEWNFKTNHEAERWLVLLQDSLRGNQYTKPPRYQWVEDNKFFLIATRSAHDWWGMHDTLTTRLTGKTKQQLSLFYRPMNLKDFKKRNGPAHSSASTAYPYLYNKGTKHYTYFYFKSHHRSREVNSEYPAQTLFNLVTAPHKPINSEENYESIKETLVGLQCGLKEHKTAFPELIDLSPDELTDKLGSVLYQTKKKRVYGHANRIIVVSLNENNKVTIYKYLRLNKTFEALKGDSKTLNQLLSFE